MSHGLASLFFLYLKATDNQQPNFIFYERSEIFFMRKQILYMMYGWPR